MRATTVSRVSLAGLTTIGVLLSQVSSAKALSLEPIYSSTDSVNLTSYAPAQIASGSWEYRYDIAVKPSGGELTSWVLPLLGISDLESIRGEILTPNQLAGSGWNLYEKGSNSYKTLWGDHAGKLPEKNGQTFGDSPWILAFNTSIIPENSAFFYLVSKNSPRTVPFIAEVNYDNYGGSGYAYEVGDPYGPQGSSPQVPTPFLGLGLAVIAAKTATRKRSV